MKRDWSLVVGERHGMLTIVSRATDTTDRYPRFNVVCDCGGASEVRYGNLQTGAVKSCGCLSRTHSLANYPVYAVWNAAMQRCHNPKSRQWPDYGARGLTVCERWHCVENFVADMGHPPFEGATLERKRNNEGYSPDNCVWETRAVQSRNKRNNRWFTFQGRTQLLVDWAGELGMNHRTLVSRVYTYGWPIERALTQPIVTSQRKEAA